MKKKCFLILLCAGFAIPAAADIRFSNQYLFYKTGMHDPDAECWTITDQLNDFSNIHFGELTPVTQLTLDRHQFELYVDEGDSILEYQYLYRYYPCGDTAADWRALDPEYFGQYVHFSGFHYGIWGLDSVPLFRLPLDTGEYCLEFSHSATVKGIEGDTLRKEYVLPGGQPFRNYFTVKHACGWGYASGKPSFVVLQKENGTRDTLLLREGDNPPEESTWFHGSDLGDSGGNTTQYLDAVVCHTSGKVDSCSYFYRMYETACNDTPSFSRISTATDQDGGWQAEHLQIPIGGNQGPGIYVLEIYGCISREDSLWTDQFDRRQGDTYRAVYEVFDADGGTDIPLPVGLTDLTAAAEQGRVVLKWSTAGETENSHFLIYRNDGIIGRVEGNGTTTECHVYRFTDINVRPGGTYAYSIADVSRGGKITPHDTVIVKLRGTDAGQRDFLLKDVHPNPFNSRTVIRLGCRSRGRVRMSVYDIHGKRVETLLNEHLQKGKYEVTWNAAGMPGGIYIVRMLAGNTVQSRKLVLLK